MSEAPFGYDYCEYCGIEFGKKRKWQRYCCDQHRRRHANEQFKFATCNQGGGQPEKHRKCASCGKPTNNYKCSDCWAEIQGKGDVEKMGEIEFGVEYTL